MATENKKEAEHKVSITINNKSGQTTKKEV